MLRHTYNIPAAEVHLDTYLLLRVAPVLETHLAVVHPGRDRRRRPELAAEPRADGAVVGRGQGVRGRREAPSGTEGGAAVLDIEFRRVGGGGGYTAVLLLGSLLQTSNEARKNPPKKTIEQN